MISREHNCVFVHIPKNAGQSIEHVFLDALGLTWETRTPLLLRPNDRPEMGPPRLAHLKSHEYVRYGYMTQQEYDDAFTFAFVRDPWARVVSMYKYLGFDRKMPFGRFVGGEFRKRIWKDDYWFVGPQCEYVYHNGALNVDFVGRVENLDTDFAYVCARVGLPRTSVPKVNASAALKNSGLKQRIRRWMKGQRQFPVFRDFRDYYDDESVQIVTELYCEDIERFGYSF